MLGTIIGSGINLVANGIGSWLANKRAKEAQIIQDEEYKRQREELTSELNSNYLDRADSQNVIRKVTDANEEAMRQLNTSAIRGGATDEAKVAMASKLNKNVAGVVGDLAAMGEQRKDQLRQERRQLDANYAGIKSSRLSDTSGIANMVNGIATAANTLGKAWDLKGGDVAKSVVENMPTQQDIAENAHISVEDILPNEETVGDKINRYQLRYGSTVF